MEITRRELLTGAAALGVAGALPQALPGLVPAQTTQKKLWPWTRASWSEPKRSGKAERYFSVLKWAAAGEASTLSDPRGA